MRHLNYNHLLYFWTVAREGSIARASAVLHLAPQTISGQLKLLEEAVGRGQERLEQDEIDVLIVDGQNNHAWPQTTPVLRAILEEVLLNTMYDLPGRTDIGKVVIDENTVLGYGMTSLMPGTGNSRSPPGPNRTVETASRGRPPTSNPSSARIASSSVESIARQPEASGDIRGSMILTAALIEGVALFACAICFMIQSKF